MAFILLSFLFINTFVAVAAEQRYLNHVDFYPKETSVYAEYNMTVAMNEWLQAHMEKNITIFSVETFRFPLDSIVDEEGLPLKWDELASGGGSLSYTSYVQVLRLWYYSDQIETDSFQISIANNATTLAPFLFLAACVILLF